MRSHFSYQVVAGSTTSAHFAVSVIWWSTSTTSSISARRSWTWLMFGDWSRKLLNVRNSALNPFSGYGTAGFIVSVGPVTQ